MTALGGGGALPTGTVAFLRSDIEGSTRFAESLGRAWDAIDERHRVIVRRSIAANGGYEVRTEGDAFLVAFVDPGAALRAAASIQLDMAAEPWPAEAPVRVRLGLHAGAVHAAGDDYGGTTLHRLARIAAAGSGGQTLVSDAVRALTAGDLPAGCTLSDLGWVRLRGLSAPEHLFQLDVGGLPGDHPPLRDVVRADSQIPIATTSFLGRADDLQRLDRLVAGSRLVTVTGTGGCGKTRLVIELAHRVADRFPDGVWFVDLQTISDPAAVLPAVAHAVGLRDGPAGPAVARLADHLATRTCLIILDNAEQVLAAARDIAGLLDAGPGSRFLVTSRIPLGVRAEQIAPLRPLAPGEPAATDLFIERLLRARPDQPIDEETRRLAGRIGRAVDGLPLGIELAAARARSLPLRTVAERLEAWAPLPGSGPADLPERHRTLERTIDWSLDLLEPPVRTIFARLAVAEGGVALEQATAISGASPAPDADVLDALSVLADHSLVSLTTSASGELRATTLETIRRSGLRRLAGGDAQAPEPAIRAEHARVYLELSERASRQWGTRRQAAWVERLDEDDANLRAALAWSVAAGDVTTSRRFCAALWRYWLLSGRLSHGRATTVAVLGMPGGDRVDPSLVGALDAAGGLAYWVAEPVEADSLYRRQLEVAQLLQVPEGIADAAFNLAHTRFAAGGPPGQQEALDLLDLADARYAELGDDRGGLRCAWARGIQRALIDPPEVSLQGTMEVLRRATAAEDLAYVALATGGLTWIFLSMGDMPAAIRWMVRGMVVDRLLGDVPSLALGLPPCAQMACATGRPDMGAIFTGAFEELCRVHGFRPPAGLEQLTRTAEPGAMARAVLGDVAFEAACATGRAMSVDEVVATVEVLAGSLGVDPVDWQQPIESWIRN